MAFSSLKVLMEGVFRRSVERARPAVIHLLGEASRGTGAAFLRGVQTDGSRGMMRRDSREEKARGSGENGGEDRRAGMTLTIPSPCSILPFMKVWKLRRESWELPAVGGIIGILNVTPDSFSDGGEHDSLEKALEHARRLRAEGADMIDVGGESTRPGSQEVAEEEEIRRTEPVIRALRQEFPELRLSIDTRHVEVARVALEAGADVVNDITGLAHPAMRELCAEMPCGIILMHMQGEPRTMQDQPHYEDVVAEVRAFFRERVQLAEQAGIDPARICLDPGIGFGKDVSHNLALIRHLEETRVGGLPLLMALSRKRFMGAVLEDAAAPRVSPLPTVAMSLLAAGYGAELHRVHDVAPLRQALRLRQATLEA